MNSRVFLTNLEVFDLVMKHSVKCLLLIHKQNDFSQGEIKDAKMSSFLSDFQTLINH